MIWLGITDVAKWTGTEFKTVQEEWLGDGRDDLASFAKPTRGKLVTKVNLRALWKYLDPMKKSWETYQEIEADYLAWKKADVERMRAVVAAREAAKAGKETAQ